MTHTFRFASVLAAAALLTAAASLIAQQNTGAPAAREAAPAPAAPPLRPAAASLLAQPHPGAPVVSDAPSAPPPKLPEITSQDLLDGLKHPSRWLSYSGAYPGRRHRTLKPV